jgi:hypothetical protein
MQAVGALQQDKPTLLSVSRGSRANVPGSWTVRGAVRHFRRHVYLRTKQSCCAIERVPASKSMDSGELSARLKNAAGLLISATGGRWAAQGYYQDLIVFCCTL